MSDHRTDHRPQKSDASPVDVQDIGHLFDLYSGKVRELEAIHNSIQITESAKAMVSGTLEEIMRRAANDNLPSVRIEIYNLERKIVEQLVKRPDDLYKLASRQFEELVCALLSDMGYEVKLTPETRDGGRDILAVAKTSIGELLTIIECKRYRAENPVSVSEIRSFLFTVRESDRASCGMFATTSYFSRDAANLAADYFYQLKLKDVQDIRTWLQQYGTWTQADRGGFWLPAPSKTLHIPAQG
jgi:restriction endonuclease Mrr